MSSGYLDGTRSPFSNPCVNTIRMTPLYTELEFKQSKNDDLLPLKCEYCSRVFKRSRHAIKNMLNPNQNMTGDVCSRICSRNFYHLKKELNPLEVSCKNCNKQFKKRRAQFKKSKSGNHFCNSSCAALYNNAHKTHGTRVSKLEVYLQEELSALYPNLEFHFNRKDAILSELDIYTPSLKLAFELNGIFHYEPIFGEKKLNQVKNNDQRKFQACLERNIELCIIDSSQLKRFKPENAKKYLDIVVNIINQKSDL